MAKAIMVTDTNREEILSRLSELDEINDYTNEELEGQGFHLVLDFGSGSHNYYGYLNKVAFEKGWVRTGQKLENGWFEVKRPV